MTDPHTVLEREVILLGDVLVLAPQTTPAEIPAIAIAALHKSERKLAAVLEAADRWVDYVVEDTAPLTLTDHLNRAIAAVDGK